MADESIKLGHSVTVEPLDGSVLHKRTPLPVAEGASGPSSSSDPEFEARMTAARRIMEKRRAVLRELAK